MSSESEWQPVRKDRSKHQTRPQVSIYADGNGHVNAAGDDFLDNPERVRLLTNPHEGLLRIDPVEEDHLDGYSFSRDEREGHTGKGGDVNFKRALGDLGADVDAFDETAHFEIEERGEFYVVDLSELPGVGAADAEQETPEFEGQQMGVDLTDADEPPSPPGDAPDDDPEDDADDDVAFDETVAVEEFDRESLVTYLERRLRNSESGRHEFAAADVAGYFDVDGRAVAPVLRALRAMDEPPVEVVVVGEKDNGSAKYCARDPDATGPAPSEVHDAIEQVDSVQELAEELEVRDGQARNLAMDAGAYGDLEDDVSPMGYGGGE